MRTLVSSDGECNDKSSYKSHVTLKISKDQHDPVIVEPLARCPRRLGIENNIFCEVWNFSIVFVAVPACKVVSAVHPTTPCPFLSTVSTRQVTYLEVVDTPFGAFGLRTRIASLF